MPVQVAFVSGLLKTTLVPVVASSDLLANIPSHVNKRGGTGSADVKVTHASGIFSIKYAVITRCFMWLLFLKCL
jgi:hypothetical protein